jgi:hypothetical protein
MPNRSMNPGIMMKAAAIPLTIVLILPTVSVASYYENWTIHATVLEVYPENNLPIYKRKYPTMDVDTRQSQVAMKVRVEKCDYRDGHGKAKCVTGKEVVIVLNYDAGEHRKGFAKGKKLKIRYSYSNGATPTGVAESTGWYLPSKKGK